MGAGIEKLAQPLTDLRSRLRMRNAKRVETLRAGSGCERSFQIVWFQKSRLA
jgi:hypothetical protein